MVKWKGRGLVVKQPAVLSKDVIGPFSAPFGLRFGSVLGPLRVRFGVLGGVGVGSGRGASVREKNITKYGQLVCRSMTLIHAISDAAKLIRGKALDRPEVWDPVMRGGENIAKT